MSAMYLHLKVFKPSHKVNIIITILQRENRVSDKRSTLFKTAAVRKW